MATDLTNRAFSASQQSNIEPQLVMQVEGVSTLFGAVTIQKIIKYGDPGLVYGGGAVYGGLGLVDDQKPYITFEGSSTKLSQSLNPDKGHTSTITSMQVSVVDKDGEITALIAPDDTQSPTFDWLGRKCTIWAGFANVAWPDDYIKVHKGIIDEIKAESGKIVFNIAHPDQKKKALIFTAVETTLSAGIDAAVTTLPVVDTTGFFKPVLQPDEVTLGDSDISYMVRIDDEIIEYTDYDGTNFLTATRARLGTLAVAHDSDATVNSYYTIQGNTIDIALKLMLSGANGSYLEAVDITNFVIVSGILSVPNAMWFDNQFLVRDYNLTNNDYITTTGSAVGANNVTGKKINSITTLSNGTYVVVDGVSFLPENDSAAVVSFRSGYDVFGEGLAMSPDDVDIDQHELIRDNFLQNFEQQFYIREDIENAKDFIELQCYVPAAAFSVPRKTRSSVSYHVGPLPTSNLKTLDDSNIKEASKLRIRRTIAKSFKNAIVYRYEEDKLEIDRFIRNFIRVSADSLAQIPVGKKALTIPAKGLRDVLSAESIADNASFRLLDRYQFSAEIVENVKVNYKTGFNIEVGDIVVFDMASLKMTDVKSGTRDGAPRLMEVSNFSLDLKTFDIILKLTDTNFSLLSRYALIPPTSLIKSASSGQNFILEVEGDPRIGVNEYLKWQPYVGAAITVHNFDHTIVGTSFISAVNTDNSIVLTDPLGFTPTAGMYFNMDDYTNQPDSVKLVYGFMSDADNDFADGGIAYQMI